MANGLHALLVTITGIVVEIERELCAILGRKSCFFPKQIAEVVGVQAEFVGTSIGQNVKIYSKILTLVGHTIQNDCGGSEVLKRVPSSRFSPKIP